MADRGAEQGLNGGEQPPADSTEPQEAHARKAHFVDDDADVAIFAAGEEDVQEEVRDPPPEREAAASSSAEAGKAAPAPDEPASATQNAAPSSAGAAASAEEKEEERTANNPPEGIAAVAPETSPVDKAAIPQERLEEAPEERRAEEPTSAPVQQQMGEGMAETGAKAPLVAELAVNAASAREPVKAPIQEKIVSAEPMAAPISRMWLSAHLQVGNRLFVCSTAQEDLVRLATETLKNGGESLTFVASEDTRVTYTRMKPPICNCNCQPVRYTFDIAVDGKEESGEIIFNEAPGFCRTLCGYEEFVGLSVRFGGQEKFTCVVPKQEACQCCSGGQLSFAGCVAKCCAPCAPIAALMCLPCLCCEFCCLMCCAGKPEIVPGHAPFLITSLPIYGPAGGKEPAIGHVQWVWHGGALVNTNVQVEGTSLAEKLGLLMIPWLMTRFEQESGEKRVREWGQQATFVINRLPKSVEAVEFFEHLKTYNP